MTRIVKTRLKVEREPLAAPFGFKGGYLSELWQSLAGLEGESGRIGIGLGVQSVLWSDERVFRAGPEAAGNELMLGITREALRLAEGRSFAAPAELLAELLPRLDRFARNSTGLADLRPTFMLNALVAVDQAAWVLHGREAGATDLDRLLPGELGAALAGRQRRLAAVPLFTYGLNADQIAAAARGRCLVKIKLGADPDQDGDLDKMLAWDCARLTQIHEILRDYPAPDAAGGKVAYYLDANGRYDRKDRVWKLLDQVEKIGALGRILLLEEPFPQGDRQPVGDLPVRVAADESLHSLQDVRERIDLGYGALTLKPVAKTLSLSLQFAALARTAGVPCFCADLTVNPVMVEWNKWLAARLEPLPGLKVGVVETNGAQNYRDWPRLRTYHPFPDAPWAVERNGYFELDDDFFARSGGIFADGPHYRRALGL